MRLFIFIRGWRWRRPATVSMGTTHSKVANDITFLPLSGADYSNSAVEHRLILGAETVPRHPASAVSNSILKTAASSN